MRNFESSIVIFSVMLCWASAYVFIKGLPAELSSFGYLALMNGLASLIMVLCFFPRLKKLNRYNAIRGSVLGLLMMLVLLFEKEGIERLTPAAVSVLASLGIVVVPFFVLVFYRRFPSQQQVAAILLILAGILVTNGVSSDDFPLAGTLFMLGDCISMSLYTVVANKFCRNSDPVLLAVTQLLFMAAVAFAFWFAENPRMFLDLEFTRSFLSSLFMLAIFSKAFAYIMLMYGQRYADPINVVVIFALEPVITLLMSICIPKAMGGVEESFTLQAFLGAVLVVLGAIVSGLDIGAIRRRLHGIGRLRDETT
ncbi:MAG: DMT family transporter [Selenomonadaceae bacterium]|nr:DMT family transporter [Selenomonadaceae bacterium]